MTRLLSLFEKFIVMVLLILMMVAVLVETIELGVILIQQLIKPPLLLLDIREVREVFGFFLMVLIGLELLETIKAYLERSKVHVEVVFLVAMVAVSRKIIIMEYEELAPGILLGMSALIVALAAGYFLVKKAFLPPEREHFEETVMAQAAQSESDGRNKESGP